MTTYKSLEHAIQNVRVGLHAWLQIFNDHVATRVIMMSNL